MNFWRIFFPQNAFSKTTMFLQNLFSVIGAHIFIVPISRFLSPKLKGRRVFRKKKDRKLRRKRGRTSFEFFQLLLSLFSKKERNLEKEEEKFLLPPTPISPPKQERGTKRRKKKSEKRKKRNKKKEKRGGKEGLFIFLSISYSFPKNEREEEKWKKISI